MSSPLSLPDFTNVVKDLPFPAKVAWADVWLKDKKDPDTGKVEPGLETQLLDATYQNDTCQEEVELRAKAYEEAKIKCTQYGFTTEEAEAALGPATKQALIQSIFNAATVQANMKRLAADVERLRDIVTEKQTG